MYIIVMQKTVIPLTSVRQTLREMKRIVDTYAGDVALFASMSLPEFHAMVRKIPYRFDLVQGKIQEVLKRPYFTLSRIGVGGDCDDKAIVMGSWAKLNGLPYRFKAVSKIPHKAYSHVYAEIFLDGSWIAADATYSHNVLGKTLYPYKKVLTYG